MPCLLCGNSVSREVWSEGRFSIARCAGCGVLFTINPLSQAELIGLYDEGALTGTPTELIGKVSGPPPAWKQREHIRLLDGIRRLGVSGGSLLDVGSFEGMFLNNARQYGFVITGVEPMGDAFTYTHDVLSMPIVHGDLQSAAFPAESFSVVTLLDVIEHIIDPVTELREVLRILKPGGLAVITTPNAAGLLQRVVGAKRKLFGQSWCPIDGVPWHLWGFTPATIRVCMQKAGFHVESVESLEPSALSTNENAGSAPWKRVALRAVSNLSKVLRMSDRTVGFARKPAAASSSTRDSG